MPKHQNQQEEPDLELPDNIKMLKDAEVIYDTEDYQTAELPFPDPTGRTAFTVTLTRLRPGKQTRGHRPPKYVEWYVFQRGSGWVLLHNKAFEVKPNMCILVPVDVWVKVINTSSTDELVFMTCYPGNWERPDVQRKR